MPTLVAEATKTEDGQEFPASDYAYVPDPDRPSTWKLRLTSRPGGPPDPRIVGMAVAALGPGFRGNRVEIPPEDLPAVKRRVRAAWLRAHPDKGPDDLPDVLRESDAVVTVESTPVLLSEATVQRLAERPSATVRLISPGWGSSGYYSREVLQKAANRFRPGTLMFVNHPTDREEQERPEGDLRDLAGVLVTSARWQDDPEPGLYAEVKMLPPYRDLLREAAPYIGVSIRARGKAREGEADGRKGTIIEAIEDVLSVDWVTVPGRGGKVVDLYEAARRVEESETMEDDMPDTIELQEALSAAEAERDALRAEVERLRDELRAVKVEQAVAQEVAALTGLPEAARKRIAEAVVAAKPEPDKVAEAVAEAAKREVEYLREVGVVPGEPAEAGEPQDVDLVRTFMGLGMSESAARIAAGVD